MRLLVAVFLACAMSGCTRDIESFATGNQIGSSPDYFLVKNGNDRIALIFGMTDDFSYCHELADWHMKKYPLDRYSCYPANEK